MGVMIMGLEMPCEEAEPLRIELYADGTVIVIREQDDFYEFKAVPVTPHGDLIDRDTLEQDAQKRLLMCNKNDDQFQKPYEVIRAIALAPTVIPAEPSKEEDSPAGALCNKCLCFTCEWRLSCGKLEGNTSEYCRSRCKGEAGLMTRCSEFKQRLLGEMRSVTNEEKMRNKTTFELAKFLCFLTRCPPWKHKPSCINNCVACWNDWLQSDVSEGEET